MVFFESFVSKSCKNDGRHKYVHVLLVFSLADNRNYSYLKEFTLSGGKILSYKNYSEEQIVFFESFCH